MEISDRTKKRFWSKVKKTKKCWLWQTGKFSSGYGGFLLRHKTKRLIRAHRLSWIMKNGDIPTGLFCCHKCDNPSCVRPSHLFLGTAMQNTKDCIDKGRFACGTDYPNAKLNNSKVKKIREMWKIGKYDHKFLVKKFGVGRVVIDGVIKRKSWKHVN